MSLNFDNLSKDEAVELAVNILKKHSTRITSKDVYKLISFLPPKSVEYACRKKRKKDMGKANRIDYYVETYTLNYYLKNGKIPTLNQVKEIVRKYYPNLPVKEYKNKRGFSFHFRIEKRIRNAWYRVYKRIRSKKALKKKEELLNNLNKVLNEVREWMYIDDAKREQKELEAVVILKELAPYLTEKEKERWKNIVIQETLIDEHILDDV